MISLMVVCMCVMVGEGEAIYFSWIYRGKGWRFWEIPEGELNRHSSALCLLCLPTEQASLILHVVSFPTAGVTPPGYEVYLQPHLFQWWIGGTPSSPLGRRSSGCVQIHFMSGNEAAILTSTSWRPREVRAGSSMISLQTPTICASFWCKVKANKIRDSIKENKGAQKEVHWRHTPRFQGEKCWVATAKKGGWPASLIWHWAKSQVVTCTCILESPV